MKFASVDCQLDALVLRLGELSAQFANLNREG